MKSGEELQILSIAGTPAVDRSPAPAVMDGDAQLCRDIFRALDDQRARISRNLHDQTAQQIALIKIQLELIRKKSKSISEQEQLDRVIGDVDQLAATLHGAVSELRPASLELYGLEAAIHELATVWRARLGSTISVDLFGETSTIGPETASALYHIVQEALTNIAKHAPTASLVSIMLQRTEDRIVLSIEDDGIGLVSQGRPEQPERWGLIGLRERIALVGGFLEVSSKQTSGTTITACIPWKAEYHER